MAAHEPLVRDWLAMLISLTNADLSADEARARIGALAARLAQNFPAECFCEAALEHVARAQTFFPSYAELFGKLDAWWQENQPVKAVPFDPDGITETDLAFVRNWERHASGDWGKTIPLKPDIALFRELMRYRKSFERVFNHLVATNERARAIAQRNGWIQPLRAAASTIPSDTKRGPPL
jgi:hypothetical protein